MVSCKVAPLVGTTEEKDPSVLPEYMLSSFSENVGSMLRWDCYCNCCDRVFGTFPPGVPQICMLSPSNRRTPSRSPKPTPKTP